MDCYGKKIKRAPSKALLKRSQVYQELKSEGVQVDWKTSTLSFMTNLLSQTERLPSRPNNSTDATNLRRLLTLPEDGFMYLSLHEFNRILHKIPCSPERTVLVTVLDTYDGIGHSFPLNHAVVDNDALFIDEDGNFGSDQAYSFNTASIGGTLLLEWIKPAQRQTRRSEFFRYFTKLDFDLSEFQVYTRKQFLHDKKSQEPCFLHALRAAGVSKTVVEQIATELNCAAVPFHVIKDTAIRYDLYITVKNYKEYDGRVQSSIAKYGDKANPLVELGQVAQHLFAIKPTRVTKHALQHRHDDHPSWPSIRVDHGRVVKANTYLDSFQAIAELFCHHKDLLIPITVENAPTLLNNKFKEEVTRFSLATGQRRWFREIGRQLIDVPPVQDPETGETIDSIPLVEARGNHPLTHREGKRVVPEEYTRVFFDLETFPEFKKRLTLYHPELANLFTDHDPNNSQHIPYLAAWKIGDEPTQHAFGLDCVTRMLGSLPENHSYLFWAHNLGFDIRFVLRHLSHFSNQVIEVGNKMKVCSGYYKSRHLCFKDTMSFIAEKLESLPGMFPGTCNSTTLEKECFPHEFMNVETYNKPLPLMKLQAYAEYNTLKANAERIGAIKNDALDTVAYAIHYCRRDVDVLAACFTRFRDMLLQEPYEQDVDWHVSMPGVSYAIFHNEGAYDDCYALSGPALVFARKSIVGGRVMTRDNEPQHVMNKVSDQDAVSLYPSAMSRLPGFPKGMPKLHAECIPKCDYHISRVKILSLAKERHFPLQSLVTADGTRNFTNEILGQELIMDQYALEGLVEFQGATYEIIEGLYWCDGFNTTICESIVKMFNERLKFKADKNAMEKVIKLLLNSSYGKLIQKPILKQKTFVRGTEEIDLYTRKRINRLLKRTPISTDLALFEEHKALSRHFSPAHLGVQILSMSKRIMNEMMCLAEDLEINIWYQDTDSMHIDLDGIPKLNNAFREKYGRELQGKHLGNFHNDFELEGSEGRIYAEESYFIAKKTYIDFLAWDGNDAKGVHMRMKSIPSKLLAKPRYIKGNDVGKDDLVTARIVYEALWNGKDVGYDLADVVPLRIGARTQKVMKVSEFPRVVRGVNKDPRDISSSRRRSTQVA